ncbi:MAG: hypothetical protein AAF202_11845, partial [Pseudomonadota bacterium]
MIAFKQQLLTILLSAFAVLFYCKASFSFQACNWALISAQSTEILATNTFPEKEVALLLSLKD